MKEKVDLLRDGTMIKKDVAKKITDYLKEEETFVEPAFMSTSLNIDPRGITPVAIDDRPALLEIVVPQGIEGAYLGSSQLATPHKKESTQNEFLINKGYEFKYKNHKIIAKNGREHLYINLELTKKVINS